MKRNPWITLIDPLTKREFFYNSKTGKSQWDNPAESFALKEEKQEENLGIFEKFFDPITQRYFYFNKLEGVSQWERPVDFTSPVKEPRVVLEKEKKASSKPPVEKNKKSQVLFFEQSQQDESVVEEKQKPEASKPPPVQSSQPVNSSTLSSSASTNRNLFFNFRCVAIESYVGQNEELSFCIDDVIEIIEADSKQKYWKGKLALNGQVGYFSPRMVKIVQLDSHVVNNAAGADAGNNSNSNNNNNNSIPPFPQPKPKPSASLQQQHYEQQQQQEAMISTKKKILKEVRTLEYTLQVKRCAHLNRVVFDSAVQNDALEKYAELWQFLRNHPSLIYDIGENLKGRSPRASYAALICNWLLSHENGGDLVLKKVMQRASVYPNSLFLTELTEEVKNSRLLDTAKEEEEAVLLSDFVCVSIFDLYVLHLAIQKYLSSTKQGQSLMDEEALLSQFGYIPFDSSEFEENCTYHVLSVKPSREELIKRAKLSEQAIANRIRELREYISLVPDLQEKKIEPPPSLGRKLREEEELKEKRKIAEREIASIEKKILSPDSSSKPTHKVMPPPSKYKINVEVNKEKLFASLPTQRTPTTPARKVAVEVVKPSSHANTVSPPGLKRFSPNGKNTSFDRGTYFGTYSSNQAATLRAVGRTNSTMWR